MDILSFGVLQCLRRGALTMTRMSDELVDMGYDVLVGARSQASSREGVSCRRARAAAPERDEHHREHSTREGVLHPISWG